MARKIIAVCLTGYDPHNEVHSLEGIHERCAELDIELLVFFNSVIKPALNAEYTLHKKTIVGEMQVYELINYDMLDGMLIFGGTFLDDKTFYKIVKNCKEHGIPLLDLDDLSHDVCRRVLLTDGNAMEDAVDHLIEVHGCRDICFMNGFKDNPQSDSRLAAYKDSLEKHGIPFEEKKVYYGCFWRQSYDEAKRMIDDYNGGLPDALVCANDTMAMYCMDAIKDSGYSIPKDILVTGFDAIPDGLEYMPSLTSVRRGLEESGRTAVDTLIEMMNGSTDTETVYVKAVVTPHQSCGCEPIVEKEDYTYDERIGKVTFMREFNQYILHMHHSFAGTDKSSDMFHMLVHGAELMKIPELYACVSAEIEHKKSGYNADEEPKGLTYVPPRMVSMLMWGHYVPVGTEFETSKLLPNGVGVGEKADAHMIAPLYFKNTFLGYLALRLTEVFPDGDLFSNWLMTICNNVGSYYMNNQLEEALAELQSLYLHDPLTGIYNRRGMNKFEKGFVRESLREGRHVAIVCADVDGLKHINDNYGHEEGDNAIVQSTHAIKTSFPDDSICVRTGGDEFTVIAAFDEPDEVKNVIEQVGKHIEGYNEQSGKPYKVGCSCGFYLISPDLASDMSLEAAKKKADMAMYNEKLRRKAVRMS